ncbi:hypothetical protein COX86_03095 [Candidatus Micrarchaeota archaeon CG_4_10_14_0_2_um_filter_60_11]|nr:MAG: hypothetical protein COU39_02585 [Candidatus Micrarchaeota archaeon CG10_big_fil_rev_8_21_14_0_10_60_32]PIO01991.1 MAG: hypothetical protein COT58_02300 [Candidatus Micrarchaeota archaeon CG09_land_8_20_14_0_10_60_16]PIY91418.1 MAG: hypothetical protein COY71_03280 [Candidatus Micrarchaeota archaeon CG_4_10_14_0_8_um_filter_60_7]PIZ90786.1 MAG: hypothetical protein COX86_03095 [Candidatus Micrarchaeota archaeon CG_4_10_14_0_2_um_filter_60_11]
MALFDLFGKKPAASAAGYELDYAVHPLRLKAHTADYAQVEVHLTNTQPVESLTALVVTVPKGLGFEGSGLSQQREIRLGPLKPGERKTVPLKLWANGRTAPGNYPVRLVAIAHYRDYGHVLNEVGKGFSLRVV